MKTIINIAGFFIIVGGTFAFAYYCGKQARHYPDPFKTVTEQMKSIQRQVGCVKIDGEIGPETTPLVNAKVRAEKKAAERKICDQYAVESFNKMAGDTK